MNILQVNKNSGGLLMSAVVYYGELKMITIDNRLKVCADMVSGNGIVCDVGTDHAYLPGISY